MSGFPRSLDPVIATDTAIRRTMPQLFETLITFDHAHDMALRPGLAERWERINAHSLRLFLRKGVAFHDGTSLTPKMSPLVLVLTPARTWTQRNVPGASVA
ncbi:hypothetical protein IVB57_28565 [Bradyrhizobium sp. CW9]|uniref:hypothetical protein n=1 Tax=Bradyrhizobium sp. CW9 TaxID=2782689 RepID=UPI001FF972C5|nr:hypothetical protein [Bradyrhizobium sp. CW9]MCK1332240.1 hypothetical protein [Bradyrhizobium sp. CW9]